MSHFKTFFLNLFFLDKFDYILDFFWCLLLSYKKSTYVATPLNYKLINTSASSSFITPHDNFIWGNIKNIKHFLVPRLF